MKVIQLDYQSLDGYQPVEGYQLIDEEIHIKNKTILSITDTQGIITYCDKYFVELSEYEESELVGSPHSIIRHPDMPQAIYNIIWERIKNKKNILAIVKNLSKSGRYYWTLTNFVSMTDNNGEIVSYSAYRKPISKNAVEKIIPFYNKLREVERLKDMDTSVGYIEGYFDSLQTNYDDFIQNLIIEDDAIKESKNSFLLIKRLFWLVLFFQEFLIVS